LSYNIYIISILYSIRWCKPFIVKYFSEDSVINKMFIYYVEHFSILRLISYSLSILILGFLIKNTNFLSVYLSLTTALFMEPGGLLFINYLINRLLLEKLIFNSNKIEYLLKFFFTWITIILIRGCLIDICLVLDSIFSNCWLDCKYLATKVLNQTLLKTVFPLLTEIPILNSFLNSNFFILFISNILSFFEEIWTFDIHCINSNIVYENLNIDKSEVNDIKVYNNLTKKLIEKKTSYGWIEKLKKFLEWPEKPISSQSPVTWKQLNQKHLVDIDSKKLLPKISIPLNNKPSVDFTINIYDHIISKLSLSKLLETKFFIVVENSSKNFILEVTSYDINYKDNLILKGKLDKPFFEETIPQLDTNIYVFMADIPDKGKGKAINTEYMDLTQDTNSGDDSDSESRYNIDVQNAINNSRADFRNSQQVGESSHQGAWRNFRLHSQDESDSQAVLTNNEPINLTNIAAAALGYQPNNSSESSNLIYGTQSTHSFSRPERIQLETIIEEPIVEKEPSYDPWEGISHRPSPSVDSFESPLESPNLSIDEYDRQPKFPKESQYGHIEFAHPIHPLPSINELVPPIVNEPQLQAHEPQLQTHESQLQTHESQWQPFELQHPNMNRPRSQFLHEHEFPSQRLTEYESQNRFPTVNEGRHLRSSGVKSKPRPSILTQNDMNEIDLILNYLPDPLGEINKYNDKIVWPNPLVDLITHNNRVILKTAYEDGNRALIKYNIHYIEGKFIAWDKNRISRRLAIILQFISDEIGGFDPNEFNDNTALIKFFKLYYNKKKLNIKSLLNLQ
jgi:hypothetical protein